MGAPRITIDYETRSAADIRDGAWVYARHPSTRILCLAFRLPGQSRASVWAPKMWDEKRSLWVPEHQDFVDGVGLDELYREIERGTLVEAHNVMFERAVTHWLARRPTQADELGGLGMSMPEPDEAQWRCSAAKAAAFALPRALGQACEALDLPIRKDGDGRKLMLKYSKPRPLRKSDTGPGPYWREYDEADFQGIYSYCRGDVDAEHALSEVVPDLSEFEQKVWFADFKANWRGVKIDLELAHAAIELDEQVKRQLNDELYELTGIPAGTLRRDILHYLNTCADLVPINDTAAPTLDWLMRHKDFRTFAPSTQRVIEIARDVNRTSVVKYHRALTLADPDDHCIRDLVMYNGAATGRWAGKGLQVQNLPRGDLTGPMEDAVNDVKTRDLEWCRLLHGDPLRLLSSTLRGLLVPRKGRVFYVADYSAIEARVVLWLANAQAALEVFRRGDDIYCDMASFVYRRPVTKMDKAERQFGKVIILGLGYGMGFLTFLLNMRGYNMRFSEEAVRGIIGDDADRYFAWVRHRLWPKPPDTSEMSNEEATQAKREFASRKRMASMDHRRLRDARETPEEIIHELALCKYVVDAYRARYSEVKQLWADQETAAIELVMEWEKARNEWHKTWGEDVAFEPGPMSRKCGLVTWTIEGRWLECRLPSGRPLRYCDPYVKWDRTPWGEKRPGLRFMGVHKKTKQWASMGTYGGSIVENITQATARDMMAVAMVAADESDAFDPVTTIHDELLAEGVDDGVNRKEEFEHLMITLPAWAEGCPVTAEGDLLRRYQK